MTWHVESLTGQFRNAVGLSFEVTWLYLGLRGLGFRRLRFRCAGFSLSSNEP